MLRVHCLSTLAFLQVAMFGATIAATWGNTTVIVCWATSQDPSQISVHGVAVAQATRATARIVLKAVEEIIEDELNRISRNCHSH